MKNLVLVLVAMFGLYFGANAQVKAACIIKGTSESVQLYSYDEMCISAYSDYDGYVNLSFKVTYEYKFGDQQRTFEKQSKTIIRNIEPNSSPLICPKSWELDLPEFANAIKITKIQIIDSPKCE